MLDSVLPTPVKLTYSEILLSATATLAFQAIEKSGRPIVQLSELCEKPQYGHTASAQAEGVGPRFLRITDIKAGSVDWNTVPYCDCPQPAKYLLKPGDILVARSGSVGKSFLVSDCPEPTVFASYMIRIRARAGILAGYIYWLLQTRQFWLQIRESKRGSAMKNINSKMLSSVRIPDATPSQQNAVVSFLTWFQNRLSGGYEASPPNVPELLDTPRIVARIEELAALIEEARELRVKAREEVDALLASAIRQVFDVSEELPTHWRWVTVSDIGSKKRDAVQTGPFGAQLSSSEFTHEGIPVLAIGNVQWGYLDTRDLKYVSDEKASQLSRYQVQPGDILFARMGTVGRSCVVPDLAKDWLISYHLIRIAVDRSICDSQFTFYALRGSPSVLEAIEEKSRGSTRAGVNSTIIRQLEFPLPPLEEQRRIVAHLDDLQAQVAELTALQAATQAELDALLPSVLDKAFRGEL